MTTFKIGDWVEWGGVPYYPDIPLFAKVIAIDSVELNRTLRHPFQKRMAQQLILEGEHGTILTRYSTEVSLIPSVEEKLGDDYA